MDRVLSSTMLGSNKEIWFTRFRPEPIYRYLARKLINLLYCIDYAGMDKIPDTGPALIIGNHVSYIDGVIIQAGCKRPIRFVIDKFIYKLPGVHYFMRHNRAIPIAATKEDVAKALDLISEGLEQGDLIFIFPEGQLTYSGHLGRFKPGIQWMIERNPVPIYPIALKGLWGSIFSRKYRKSHRSHHIKRYLRRLHRPRRKVSVICGEPIPPEKARIDHLQATLLEMLHK